MNSESQILLKAKKTKFKSADKLVPYLKRKFPETSIKEIKDIVTTQIPHDLYTKKIRENSVYFNKNFSQSTNAYQMDIFVNSNGNPPYYLMFINANTRFAVAISLRSRNTTDVLQAIKDFVSTHKVKTIISDNEPAFMSQEVIRYLISKDIDLYTIIAENMNTGLAIINRFMRTIRDLKGKNKPIDRLEMNSL